MNRHRDFFFLGLCCALSFMGCDALNNADDGGTTADGGAGADTGGTTDGGGLFGDTGGGEDGGTTEDAGVTDTGSGATCEAGKAPAITWAIDATETLTQAINDVVVLPDGSIIAGGDDGMYATFDGTSWTETQINKNANTITCLWGSSKDNVYAFGNHAYHWDGTAWTEIASWHVGDTCLKIWGTGTDDIWMTINGNVIRYAGGSFVEQDTSALGNGTYTGVWGLANGHVYISGTGNVSPNYAKWDGTAWAPLTDKMGTNSNDVFALSDTDVWFTGHFSDVFHWDGTDLAEHAVGPGMEDFGTIRAACQNQVYFIADRNSASSRGVYQYDGVAWTEIETGDGADYKQFRDFEITKDGKLLVVGQDAANKALIMWGTPTDQ